MPQTPLSLIPGGPQIARPNRIWIDSDAACGATSRTDPDDCLAILWLAARRGNIVGISTSFGNASGAVVAERMAALASIMAQDGLSVPAIFRGYAEPALPQDNLPPGVVALQAVLDAGPLTILALGPLTNLAAALKDRPDLRGNVTRIVAVMGHQPGQLFHPTEAHGTGAVFGHGPIFRDLNVSVDPDAVRSVLAMNLPMTLIPYDAALGTASQPPEPSHLAPMPSRPTSADLSKVVLPCPAPSSGENSGSPNKLDGNPNSDTIR